MRAQKVLHSAGRRPSHLAPWLLLACSMAACSDSSGAERVPNVLLITLDTTRADYLSSYAEEGAVRGRTPHFDALAEDGVLFAMAVSTAAVTPVSHASILTGLYQYRHGLRVLIADSGFRLPERSRSLASVLRERGWHTGAVHSAFPVSSFFGLDQGFSDFDSVEANFVRDPNGNQTWDVRNNQRRSDETTNLAIEFMQEQGRDPFMLWIHYWDPHDPGLLPPAEYLKDVKKRPGGRQYDRRALYAAEVNYVDLQFGRLIESLKALDLYEDTLIIVTADHGEGLGQHNWGAHRILYQEQIHVPLIVRVPGARRGARVDSLVSLVDIFPTVLDYLDVASPTETDGRSLRPLIEGTPDEPRRAYADQINGYDHNAKMLQRRPQADFLFCVMEREWKLIYRPTRPDETELYNLLEDPHELDNRYAKEPAVRLRLLRDLAQRNGWVTGPFEPDANLNEAQRTQAQRALEQVGYAGGESQDAPSEDRWSWTCAEHSEVLESKRGRCPRCEELLILRVR